MTDGERMSPEIEAAMEDQLIQLMQFLYGDVHYFLRPDDRPIMEKAIEAVSDPRISTGNRGELFMGTTEMEHDAIIELENNLGRLEEHLGITGIPKEKVYAALDKVCPATRRSLRCRE